MSTMIKLGVGDDAIEVEASGRAARLLSGLTPVAVGRFHGRYIPEPNSGCWLWTAAVGRRGYGVVDLGASGRFVATHVSLAIVGRPVPDGLSALHKCDNPFCVNPEHLFIGTHRENMRDAIGKGRLRAWNKGNRRHRPQEVECRGCGKTFQADPSRSNLARRGGRKFCSVSCGQKNHFRVIREDAAARALGYGAKR